MSDWRFFADITNLTHADKYYNQVFSAMNSGVCLYPQTMHKLATCNHAYMIEPGISANGHNIKRVKTYKSLGFELDELLS
jgi:hypothetical protein